MTSNYHIINIPNNLALYNQLGIIYLNTKQYQSALDSFNHALTIDAYFIPAII